MQQTAVKAVSVPVSVHLQKYTDFRNNFTIYIDNDLDNLLTDFGKAVIKDRYAVDQESIQEAFARASCAFADDADHAQRLYFYVSHLWFMFASPLLSNGGKTTGLPISCFLNYIEDSREGLAENLTENIWLSTSGGGIGSYFGHVRSNGSPVKGGVSQSTGVIPFIKVVDSQMLAYQQGRMRRGSAAVYLDVAHPEIVEFINIRKMSGDPNRKCRNLHNAVNIPDAFMQAVKEGKMWDLIDPHTQKVIESVDARSLWLDILKIRMETGEPYLHFIDTANKALPKFLKDKGLKIHSSNLCQEIELPTSKDRTAVCCLSSVNLEKFDEWKEHPTFIEDLMRMLDNVLDTFIKDAPAGMHKAIYSAVNSRDVGLGAMGFHSFLQAKKVPFESAVAKSWNHRIFSLINDKSLEASKKLAIEKGEAHDARGYGLRFSHRLAIAPNANSGIMCGNTSPSIEPFRANAFTQKTLSGSFLVKNHNLEKLLTSLGKNTNDVWVTIINKGGSVQHLDFLDKDTKDTYKTAIELNQEWIIEHAADRQQYICQGQSVNLFFPPDIDIATLHKVHFSAWEKGVKGLYYLRSETLHRAENVNISNLKNETVTEGCLGCEG